MFCTITEGLCLYALPRLTEANQNIFIWFVITFPIILLGLFFYTIIKHHTKLYSPSDFETKDNSFVEIFYDKTFQKKESQYSQVSKSSLFNSFTPFSVDISGNEMDKKSIKITNNFFQGLDSVLPKQKLSRIFYKQFNSRCYLVDFEIKEEYRVEGKDMILPFVLMNFESEEKITLVLAGSGVSDSENGDLIINHIINTIGSNAK